MPAFSVVPHDCRYAGMSCHYHYLDRSWHTTISAILDFVLVLWTIVLVLVRVAILLVCLRRLTVSESGSIFFSRGVIMALHGTMLLN